MKKAGVSVGVVMILMLVGSFFFKGNTNLLVSAHETYDIVQGELDGHVIQQDGKVLNRSEERRVGIERFYKQMRCGNDDHIIMALSQAGKYEIYELHFSNGKLKLFYDMNDDGQGRKEYKVKVYESMKKIYKKDKITYLLVNGEEERAIVSYNLNE